MAEVSKQNDLTVLNSVFQKFGSTIEKGQTQQLSRSELAEVLASMLFEFTKAFPNNRLVEIRDYKRIEEVGAFKYSGQIETMHNEKLIPEDVYQSLKAAGRENHIGPIYLRVKGLLTHVPTREFFGRQMAFIINDYLKQHPLEKSNGFVVCVPNMTGGAWIGDETGRQLQKISTQYKVWPATPYAREMRKAIDDKDTAAKFGDHVEGLMPTAKDTAAVICFEELRTACETTQNATNMYRRFGYNEEAGVKIIEASAFDYLHKVGIQRLLRLDVDGLFLIDGKSFLAAAKKFDYINDAQFSTASEWLDNPWKFTRHVMPSITSIRRA